VNLRWYGQSAFLLTGERRTVFIDPFGDLSAAPMGWRYPPISGARADVLLVTHEHRDHNAVEAVEGEPHVVRSTAGTFEDTPLGTIVSVASEHDQQAGTARGANTIVRFELDGLRVAHFGDFGQAELRPEQEAALGAVDLVFLPVGGGPTLGADGALEVVRRLSPRIVVPMHYRTPAIDFLEPADAFLDDFPGDVVRWDGAEGEVPADGRPLVLVPAPPA
jgi:L-ascorbate metabolism protein UlaG (beta-lactamase superfamily)